MPVMPPHSSQLRGQVRRGCHTPPRHADRSVATVCTPSLPCRTLRLQNGNSVTQCTGVLARLLCAEVHKLSGCFLSITVSCQGHRTGHRGGRMPWRSLGPVLLPSGRRAEPLLFLYCNRSSHLSCKPSALPATKLLLALPGRRTSESR